MHLGHWATIVAFLSTGVCFVGMAFLKSATDRMPPLYGARPFALAAAMLSSPVWAVGFAVVGVGFALQFTAVATLSLTALQPAMLAGVVFLPIIAVALGERPRLPEAACMGLAAASTLLYAGAAGSALPLDQSPSATLLLAAMLPSLAFPAVLFLASDMRRKGAHERPLSGITYGVSAGMLIGAGEVALVGIATHRPPLEDLASSPNPYLFIIAAMLAAGQIQIAFQRRRLLIVGFLVIMVANPQMLLVSMALYGNGWEPGFPSLVSLPAGLVLNFVAIWFLPRHEEAGPAAPSEPSPPPAEPAPDEKPFAPRPRTPHPTSPVYGAPVFHPQQSPPTVRPPSLRDRIAQERTGRSTSPYLDFESESGDLR